MTLDGSVYSIIHSSIPSLRSLTTSPYTLPKQVLQRVKSAAWSFNLLFPRFQSRAANPVPIPSVCPSIMCFRRHFQRKMWQIQLTFLAIIVCRIFLVYLTHCNTSSFLIRLVQLIFSITTFQNFKCISYIFDSFIHSFISNLSDDRSTASHHHQ
jgi:hypothetical protein